MAFARPSGGDIEKNITRLGKLQTGAVIDRIKQATNI